MTTLRELKTWNIDVQICYLRHAINFPEQFNALEDQAIMVCDAKPLL